MKSNKCVAGLVLLILLLGSPLAAYTGSVIGNRFLIHNDGSAVETEAAVAYNSQNQEYLVVWQAEFAGPIREVWGQRVSRGGILRGSAFRISPANGGYNPDVAYNSTVNQYLVVYETGSDIHGQRVSNTGGLVGGEIEIAAGYGHGAYHYHNPAVAYASTADRYLVAFQYNSDLDGSTCIDARAYLSNGSPEDYAFEVGPYSGTTLPDLPDLAYNRSRDEFLVVWQQTYEPGDRDIYGRRVKMSGGAGVEGSEFAITISPYDDVNAAVAAIPTVAGEGQYLVVWESSQDIQARTVGGTGIPGTLRTLASTAWGEYRPAAAGCESNMQFLVVWTWIPVVTPPAMMQVQGRTLALDGTPLHDTVYVGGGQVFDSALDAGPVGDFLVAFDDNEVFGISNRGIYGLQWGNRLYLPLVLRD